MRSKGGFLLIEIDKNVSDVTSDDFDEKIFNEIFNKKLYKPLIIHFINGYYIFNSMSIYATGITYFYSDSTFVEGQLDGYTNIALDYNTNDGVTFTYTSI